jgi:hypothetical protein
MSPTAPHLQKMGNNLQNATQFRAVGLPLDWFQAINCNTKLVASPSFFISVRMTAIA